MTPTPSIASVPSEAGALLQSERVTVMPSKFYIPPKQYLPWKKIGIVSIIGFGVAVAIVGIAWLVTSRIRTAEFVQRPQTPPTSPAAAPAAPATPIEPASTIPPSSNPPLSSNNASVAPTASSVSTSPSPSAVPPNSALVPFVGIPDRPLVASADLDTDGLSDVEELLLGTDGSKSDTDNDGFTDGRELLNLYSPNDPDPNKKLWETSSVNKYRHPVAGFELLYPSGWSARSLQANGESIGFSSPNGSIVTVTTVQNATGERIGDWMARTLGATDTIPPTEIKTRSGILGLASSTGLVSAIPFVIQRQNWIIVVSYQAPPEATQATERTLYQMMVASLQDPGKEYWPFTSSVPNSTPVIP